MRTYLGSNQIVASVLFICKAQRNEGQGIGRVVQTQSLRALLETCGNGFTHTHASTCRHGHKIYCSVSLYVLYKIAPQSESDCCAVGLQNATVLKGKWLWMPMSSCQRACNSCEYLRPLRSEVQQQIVDTGKLCLQMKHCVHLTAAPMSADARLSPWQCLLFSRTAPCRTLHLLTLHQS